MYKMITTGLLCIAAVALKAQDAPIDSVDHTKSNTLGASSTVYTNDLIKYQSATILTGLQGRLKGLNVSPFRGMQLLRTDANTKSDIVGAIPNVGGGIYGDNSEFLISARGQSPVAIVDGVERDLYSIDPEAIESVTIQKDALSNMFLGMRSSRGALIITTKNPDTKGGFHLSLTGKFGISKCIEIRPKSTFGLSICLFAQRSIAQ
ncbi:TonB-dependent receptor plug domain-containing protein [Bacteroides xylanisolvens]|nr:TonB-dependent receptor plug domain-containing protein [Bacteroides xylanisolvens]